VGLAENWAFPLLLLLLLLLLQLLLHSDENVGVPNCGATLC